MQRGNPLRFLQINNFMPKKTIVLETTKLRLGVVKKSKHQTVKEILCLVTSVCEEALQIENNMTVLDTSDQDVIEVVMELFEEAGINYELD